MAFSSSISALLLYLLAAILVPNLTPANASVKSSSQLISEVCSKVPNSALCLEALKSDPRSANADLVGLGRISIDLTKAATKTTYELINSLLNKTSDPRLRGRYDFCSVCYGRAVSDLNESEKSLSSGKYLELNNFAAAALGEKDLCEDNFDVQPEQLKQAIQKAEDLWQYSSCLENFGDAADSLDESEESLRSGDYASIKFSASAASTDAETCQDTFDETPGTGEPEELKQAIKKAEDLCSIILVISNRLSGRPL
ncbi:hypothetical protein RJ639_043861 [Escallonia herrerae]|uniref:Pectinesterase inhibitor domain-containing protein n=1 Tax=Escallonia herrerae TaxID=1293975 RepID=A0AA89B566_9ASTE|nr:hypothetical protein RJ639_043861 [Escallonia herrerae]